MDPFTLFLIFLKANVLSVGGLSALPLLREDLVMHGVATEQQIIEALAIGRLSTGPSGLYVTSLGYFVGGWPGAVAATLAAIVPPLAIVPAAAYLRRQLLSSWFSGLMRGVTITASGLVIATGIGLIEPELPFAQIPLWQFGITAAVAAFTVHGKVHPALLIVGGGVIGLALGR